MYGFVGVPLYDSQSLECQVHIINQTELHVICVADESKIKKLLQAKEELKFVKTIISFEEVSDATCGSVQAAGWKFLTFKQLKGFGSEILKPISPSRPDDIFVIMYTSGTTGVPKGVVLTHKAFISEVESIARSVRVSRRDCYQNFLFCTKNNLFSDPGIAYFKMKLVQQTILVFADMQWF